MSSQKSDASNNIMYSIIGGAICCYFVPDYIPIVICFGGLIICAYGVIDVLKKYENINDMNFVEKEKVEYFKIKK